MGTKDQKLCAWAIEHNSHGLVYDTLVFLPEGVEPETREEWRRLPWLDGSGVVDAHRKLARSRHTRCEAWSYPGHQSWDVKLNKPDGRQCALDARHPGPHELTGPWTAIEREHEKLQGPSVAEIHYTEPLNPVDPGPIDHVTRVPSHELQSVIKQAEITLSMGVAGGSRRALQDRIALCRDELERRLRIEREVYAAEALRTKWSKDAINKIIDRVEALRVRLDSARTTNLLRRPGTTTYVDNDVIGHWSSLCQEALAEAIELRREIEKGKLRDG